MLVQYNDWLDERVLDQNQRACFKVRPGGDPGFATCTVERRVEGDGDLIAVLDAIRPGGGDARVGQNVGRPRRQLPHLDLAVFVLDRDVQRAMRVRKRKL